MIEFSAYASLSFLTVEAKRVFGYGSTSVGELKETQYHKESEDLGVRSVFHSSGGINDVTTDVVAARNVRLVVLASHNYDEPCSCLSLNLKPDVCLPCHNYRMSRTELRHNGPRTSDVLARVQR